MNFAEALKLVGQKDEKGWDKKVSMLATFGEGTGYITFNQKQKQECKCKLTDDAGETHQVILRGNTLPDASWLGRRGSFLISAYQSTHEGRQYTGYSGFWNNNAQVGQEPVSRSPQPAPQAPQNDPPPANAPAQSNVSDADLLPVIRRNNVLRSVAILLSRRNVDIATVLDFCGLLHGWVETGKVDFTVTHEPADEFDAAMAREPGVEG